MVATATNEVRDGMSNDEISDIPAADVAGGIRSAYLKLYLYL